MMIDTPYQAKLYHVVEHISPHQDNIKDLSYNELVELLGVDVAFSLIDPFSDNVLHYRDFGSLFECEVNGIKLTIRERDPVFMIPCGTWFFYTHNGDVDPRGGRMCGPFETELEARNNFTMYSSW